MVQEQIIFKPQIVLHQSTINNIKERLGTPQLDETHIASIIYKQVLPQILNS